MRSCCLFDHFIKREIADYKIDVLNLGSQSLLHNWTDNVDQYIIAVAKNMIMCLTW